MLCWLTVRFNASLGTQSCDSAGWHAHQPIRSGKGGEGAGCAAQSVRPVGIPEGNLGALAMRYVLLHAIVYAARVILERVLTTKCCRILCGVM